MSLRGSGGERGLERVPEPITVSRPGGILSGGDGVMVGVDGSWTMKGEGRIIIYTSNRNRMVGKDMEGL